MGMQPPQPAPSEAVPVTAEQVQDLIDAARYDDLQDLVALFSAGVPLDSADSQGRTALHMAAANGHLAVVDYLIENGANVDATNLEKNTPLHWACLNGHIEVIKALISAGASVSALNSHEKTPMDGAVAKGEMEVVDAIGAAVAQAELGGVAVSLEGSIGECSLEPWMAENLVLIPRAVPCHLRLRAAWYNSVFVT